MVTLTSVELNMLVFRYLQESGFTHSAFGFGNEALINKSPIDGDSVPPNALITVVQKGLQYLELEANLSNNNTESGEDFSFIPAIDLLTKSPEELRRMIEENTRILQNDQGNEKDKKIEEQKERDETEKQGGKRRGRKKKDKNQEKHGVRKFVVRDDEEESPDINPEVNRVIEVGDDGPVPMDISTPSTSQSREISSSNITILEGHSSEVCTCAWSPTASLLASGSGDSTARIWRIFDASSGSGLRYDNVRVLKHVKRNTNEPINDVTTLEWNREGTLLATGTYDGQARIWTSNGELRSTLTKHKAAIFSVKWNKKGNYLLTGSFDKSTILWDVNSARCKQQFQFHTGPTLDVDWCNNASFATSSVDTAIHVCKIGLPAPLKTFMGHKGEVNCVKWDPSGKVLASCSDDKTVKIWSLKHDKHVLDLRKHVEGIYTLRWSPTGPRTINPNKQLVLASASFDSTVKIWDVVAGKLSRNLHGHKDPVNTIAFSPDGDYLATGSADKYLHIWSLKDHKIVKSYNANGSIFQVCWNKDGNKIAGCSSNNTVSVLDFRM